MEGMRPPQILKQKRTEEEKLRRHRFGEKGKKFGKGVYAEPAGDGYSNTLTTFSMDNYVWDRNYKVRELTDREAFRLMDVDPEDTEKILEAVPQKYCKKLAGNSIVVDVLTAIFTSLIKQYPNSFGEYCGKSPEEVKALKKREYARRHYEKHKEEVQRKSREYHRLKRMSNNKNKSDEQ